MTFGEVALLYLSAKNHTSKWRDQCSLNRLSPFFRDRYLADINRHQVRLYVQSRRDKGISDSTIRKELHFASAAINFVRLEHELDLKNPFHALGIPEPDGRLRWLSQDEAARLIQASRLYARTPYLPCFIRLALNTGCRRGELLGLEWSRVDFSRRLLFLEARHTKTKTRRTIPLNDAAIIALDDLRRFHDLAYPDSPWVFTSAAGGHIRWLKTGFRNSCRRAGITDFRIHDLRHTCASWLVMAGVDLYVVRDLLGHASITTTERYAHLAPAKVAAAVAVLDTPFHC